MAFSFFEFEAEGIWNSSGERSEGSSSRGREVLGSIGLDN